jgi:hypothetical protein
LPCRIGHVIRNFLAVAPRRNETRHLTVLGSPKRVRAHFVRSDHADAPFFGRHLVDFSPGTRDRPAPRRTAAERVDQFLKRVIVDNTVDGRPSLPFRGRVAAAVSVV